MTVYLHDLEGDSVQTILVDDPLTDCIKYMGKYYVKMSEIPGFFQEAIFFDADEVHHD